MPRDKWVLINALGLIDNERMLKLEPRKMASPACIRIQTATDEIVNKENLFEQFMLHIYS